MPSKQTIANKTIYKTFIGEVKEVDEAGGVIDMLIPMSTDSVDRDGEIVEPKGARKSLPTFMKRPILVSSHSYNDLRKQIGEFLKLKITDDGLMAKGIKYYSNEGNDEADWAFNLASKGMAAFSIGFIPKTWEKIDEDNESDYNNRRYTEWELLEISQVVVPSNRDAIQGVRAKAAKAKDGVVVNLMDKIDAELIAGQENKRELRAILDECVIDKDMPVDIMLKPYPDEHACRLKDPGQYDTCRRTKRTAGDGPGKGKEYSIIMCKKDDGPMEEQAYRYDKEVWPEAMAKAHCKAHDGSFEAAKEKAEIYQCECIDCGHKMESKKHCQDIKCPKCGGKMRRVERPGPGKELIEDIVNAEVVDKTENETNQPRAYTQSQLADDMDYLLDNLKSVGMGDEVTDVAINLAIEIIQRLPGADIPVEIQAKVGAVLNAKNLKRLTQIQQLAQEVIDSAEKPDDGDKQLEQEKPRIEANDVAEIATAVVALLKGKRLPK